MADSRNYLPCVPKLKIVSMRYINSLRHSATHVGDHLGVDGVLRKINDGTVSSDVEDSIVVLNVDIRELFGTG